MIADHGRGMTFLVGDGVMPSNEGRGYVLRRIIRRAVQQARSIGLDDLYRVTDVVVEQMADAYPELGEHAGAHPRRRARGGGALRRDARARDEAVRGDRRAAATSPGEDAFDLDGDVRLPDRADARAGARARARPVDEDDFRAAMEEHREISRGGARSAVVRRARRADRPTFVGYDRTEVLTAIAALEGARRRAVRGEARALALLRGGRRPGQRRGLHRARGDRRARRAAARLACRRRPGAHVRRAGEGFAVGDRVRAVVPWAVRFPTMANHTATHLLHEALRRRARRPRQAGGLGGAARTSSASTSRTTAALTDGGARARSSELVNEQIFADSPVRAFETPIDEARKLGAHDAVRREVRRRRARGRDRGLLARALRRHARTLDGRDRPVRDPLRGLGRLGRAADRGGDLRRGVRAAARARRRGG